VVASCPKCQTRFRLADDKIGPQGVRLRCSKCQAVFRVPPADATGSPLPADAPAVPSAADALASPSPVPVGVPRSPPAAPVSKPAPTAPTAPAKPAAAVSAASPPLGAAEPRPAADADARPWVLVAEADRQAATRIHTLLIRWQLRPRVVHDGAEALLAVFRTPPAAVVLGGHLPGLGAPAATEIIRRTDALRAVKLIRIAPMDEPVGAPEFEADHTVEPREIGPGIEAALRALGLGEPPAEAADDAPPETAAAPATASKAPESDPAVAAAKRLARIIVSDIILYNQERFAQAASNGNVASLLENELNDASALFRQRVPEEIRRTRNFLVEELERRAAAL
jgi:predicted Zn finger-like uncharacterized protein